MQTLSQIPRYAIEFLAFSGVLLLMVYLIKDMMEAWALFFHF